MVNRNGSGELGMILRRLREADSRWYTSQFSALAQLPAWGGRHCERNDASLLLQSAVTHAAHAASSALASASAVLVC